MTQEQELADLPASLRDIARLIGMSATLALVAAFGGTSPRVPLARNLEGHPLTLAIGMEAAKKLSEVYGGEDIYVPRCAKGLRDARDREIIARGAKEPVDKLAREYQLSDRQIWNIFKKPVDDGQSSLF